MYKCKINPFTPILVPLIDFTLSNATQFYLSIGNPSGVKGLICIGKLKAVHWTDFNVKCIVNYCRVNKKALTSSSFVWITFSDFSSKLYLYELLTGSDIYVEPLKLPEKVNSGFW